MTTLTRADMLAEIGVVGGGDAIPAAIMADYARSAMLSLCDDGLPVTTQKLTGSVEERLSPIVRFRSRTIDTFFANEETEDEPSPIRQAVDDLVEIGDFVSIGNGYHYPASPRVVVVDSSVAFIIGGAPARYLGAAFEVDVSRTTLARLAATPLPTRLPRQSLESWLGAPTFELKQWTKTQLQAALEPTVITADDWEVAAFRDGPPWMPASQVNDFGPIYICREHREAVNGSRKFLARLERANGILTAIAVRPISNLDCRRLIHGQKLLLGIARRVFATDRGDFFSIRLSPYSLPEVLQLLKALCYDWKAEQNGQIEFLILAALRDSARNFLRRYAMHLPPSDP
jgi:hypothetical protein